MLKIPKFLIYKVIINIPLCDVLNLFLTCKKFSEISQDETFWNFVVFNLYTEYYQTKPNNVSFKNWFKKLRFECHTLHFTDKSGNINDVSKIYNGGYFIDIYDTLWSINTRSEPILNNVKKFLVTNYGYYIITSNDDLIIRQFNYEIDILIDTDVREICGHSSDACFYIKKNNDLYFYVLENTEKQFIANDVKSAFIFLKKHHRIEIIYNNFKDELWIYMYNIINKIGRYQFLKHNVYQFAIVLNKICCTDNYGNIIIYEINNNSYMLAKHKILTRSICAKRIFTYNKNSLCVIDNEGCLWQTNNSKLDIMKLDEYTKYDVIDKKVNGRTSYILIN